MLNFQFLFTCTVCFSFFLFSSATFPTTTTTTKSSDNDMHDVVVEISSEILAIRQKINSAISHNKLNFTFLQNSFSDLHLIILDKINSSSSLPLISYNDSETLTENILMTISLVIERVDLNSYSKIEKSAVLTSILAIYKDWSRILGSHLKSFSPPKLSLFKSTTYVQLYSQQFCPQNAEAALFKFWDSKKQKLVMLELPIAGIASADRVENVTVTIVVSFSLEKSSFLDVQSPLISITIDNQTQMALTSGHQFNFT